MATWVLHVDLDQFLAAVEVRRRPELAGRPVIVGGRGLPTDRAVVATASYEARAFGVRSGMPMRQAARRCPDAVFLPADNPAYEAASAQVMAVLREFDVVVEVLGWDEAFLGWTGTEGPLAGPSIDTEGPLAGPSIDTEGPLAGPSIDTEGPLAGPSIDTDPEALAREVQRAVRERTGLSCAIGIGDNTLRAKMATQFGKPGGMFRLTAHNWFALFGSRPTHALWGVGSRTSRKLADLGITTVAQLAETPPSRLAERLGPVMGPHYVALARGIGRTEVVGAPWVARSRSRETTYPANLTMWDEVRAAVAVLARRVAADVTEEGRAVARVAVKVRFAPFLTSTRSTTLPAPTSEAAALEEAALAVLERFDHDRPVRLLGVRAEFVAD